MKKTTPLLLALLAAFLFAGCSTDPDDPPPAIPGDPPLDPLAAGEARLLPEVKEVEQGQVFEVHLDLATGDTVLGAFSTRLFYNRGAFELVSVQGTEPTLGAPFLLVENRPGTLYLCWTNSSPPDDTLKGDKRVASLTFKAIGGPGTRLAATGELIAMGDTAFPAVEIGTGAFPRTLEVVNEVRIVSK
jgi:hypothetical protein